MSRKKQLIIGISVSIVTIIILLYSVDIKIVYEEIIKFDKTLFYILPVFYFISLFLRSFRWKMLLDIKYRVKYRDVTEANAVGFLFNYLFPAKLGEVVRAEIIKRKYSSSRSFTLGTIIVERTLDSIVLFIFLSGSIIFSKTLFLILKENILSLIVFIILILSAILFIFSNKLNELFLKRLPEKLHKKIGGILENIKSSFGIIKKPQSFIVVISLTLLLWLFLTYYYYLVLKGLNIEIPVYAYFFIISMAAFGMILPSSPGNIGVFQGVTMASLLLFYPNKEKALSFGIIAHAFDLIPCIFFGLIALMKTDYSIFKKQDVKEKINPEMTN